MIKNVVKFLLVFGVLAATISSAYLNHRITGWDYDQKNLEQLRNVQLLDALTNQELMKIRYSIFADYDQLSEYSQRMLDAAVNLTTSNSFLTSDAIRHNQQNLSNKLQEKAKLIEHFKTNNALLKNSLINFPKLISDTKTNLILENNTNSLAENLEKLSQNIVLYSLVNDKQLDENTQQRIQTISKWHSSKNNGINEQLQIILQHAKYIIDKRHQVTEVANKLLAFPVAGQAQNLQAEVLAEHEQNLVQVNSSRALFYFLSIILIAYSIFILFKLKHKTRKLAQEQNKAMVTLQSIADGVITTDADGFVEFINPIAEQLTGWSTEDAHRKHLSDVFCIVDEVTNQPIEDLVDRCVNEDTQISSTESSSLISKLGTKTPIEESVSPIRGGEENIIGTIIVFRDVSKTRELSRKLAFQASHDSLTGVINRRAFDRRLKQAITNAQLNNHQHALLYLDLDQFKIVNDTCGHDAGDHLLIDVTSMLKQKLGGNDTLARLGGDEFGVLLHKRNLDGAQAFAKELLYEFKNFRFSWQGIQFQLGTSIGIVQITNKTENIISLLSAADIACYVAKDMGRNRFHVFHSKDKELMRRHGEMQWVSRLTQAFKEKRFTLFRQPLFPLNGQLSSQKHYELLIRLQDGEDNMILPGAFIPAAERYNFMPVLDRWVIRTAFKQCFQFNNNDQYAINLSGTSLNSDTLLEFIKREMRRTPLNPHNICFEITETAAIDNLFKAVKLVNELKQYGFKFALDDFGKGLSSYSYLSNLPVDYLKIDGGFVRNLDKNPVNYEIVKSVNHIGHLMGMKTIAECVDSDTTLRKLTNIGIDYAQGYKLGEPQPLFINWSLEEPKSYMQR